MFYCEDCREANEYPDSMFKSYGRCEICETVGTCNEAHHDVLYLIDQRRLQQWMIGI